MAKVGHELVESSSEDCPRGPLRRAVELQRTGLVGSRLPGNQGLRRDWVSGEKTHTSHFTEMNNPREASERHMKVPTRERFRPSFRHVPGPWTLKPSYSTVSRVRVFLALLSCLLPVPEALEASETAGSFPLTCTSCGEEQRGGKKVRIQWKWTCYQVLDWASQFQNQCSVSGPTMTEGFCII